MKFPVTPATFDTDWHHQLGEKLAVFPRSICFCGNAHSLNYWPDLATITVDGDTRQLVYYPSQASAFSLCVVFEEVLERWNVSKFFDNLLLQYTSGFSFDEVMAGVIECGLCCGET